MMMKSLDIDNQRVKSFMYKYMYVVKAKTCLVSSIMHFMTSM